MSPARTLLSRAVLLATGAGLVVAVVAGLRRGGEGLLGAGLGTALVLAFLLVGQIPVAQVAAGRRRLAAALLVSLYVSRVLLLLVAYRLVVVPGAGIDRPSLGLAVLACAIAWTVGTVWAALRWRPYVVGPDGRG